jgi:hypothetical protein
MSILVTCGCGKQASFPPEMAGKALRCLHCQRALVVTANGTAAPGTTAAANPDRRRGRALAAGLFALLLLLALLFLFWGSAQDRVAGSYTIDPEAAKASHPLLASSQGGVTLDLRRDGTFQVQIAGETWSGQWRISEAGQTVQLELSTPEEPSPSGRASLEGGNMVATLPGNLGTFPLTRGNGGSPQNAASSGGSGMSGRGAAPFGHPGGSSGPMMGQRMPPPPNGPAALNVPGPAGSGALITPGSGASGSASSSTASSANYSLIEERLYMGGAVSEPPPGTEATINLNQAKDPWTTQVYLWVPIPDAAPAPGLDWLQQMVAFVDAKRGSGMTTYVHCMAGRSRSGLVTVAYIMFEHHLSRDEALSFVRAKRPQANPNPAFMALLKEWEQHLGVGGNGHGGGGGGAGPGSGGG